MVKTKERKAKKVSKKKIEIKPFTATVKTGKKKCTKCGNSYPATPENFYRDKQKKDGLSCWCKPCEKKMSKEYEKRTAEKTATAAKPPRKSEIKKAARRVLAKRAKESKKASKKKNEVIVPVSPGDSKIILQPKK